MHQITPKTKRNFALILFIVSMSASLYACGGSGGNGDENPSNTVSEAIIQAEQSGDLPVLDRGVTLAGTDNDGNGVRDDIDRYIDGLPDTESQKDALRQSHSAIIDALLSDAAEPNALSDALEKISNATACIHATYDPTLASKKTHEIEKLTVNTKERFQAYENYNSAISGTVFTLPDGDGCDR